MKKGFIAIVLVLAMALCFTAFAACMPDSPSEGDPSGGGSITAPEDPGGDSGSTGGDTDNPGGGSDTDNPGSGGDTDNPSDPGSGETGGETPGTDPSDPDDNPGGGEDNPGGSGEDPDAPGTGDNPGGGEDNPGSGEDPDDPDNPGTGDNPGGGITPDDPDGTHGEEAALRALLRSVTVDMESLSASGTLYQAGGGSSPMKVEMRADVAYDSDSGTGVYLSMKSSAVDDRDGRTAVRNLLRRRIYLYRRQNGRRNGMVPLVIRSRDREIHRFDIHRRIFRRFRETDRRGSALRLDVRGHNRDGGKSDGRRRRGTREIRPFRLLGGHRRVFRKADG